MHIITLAAQYNLKVALSPEDQYGGRTPYAL